MADVQAISAWVVRLEDDPRHPGVAKDLGDGAGITRYGITSRWHSADVPAEFFSTMDANTAAGVAKNFYAAKYCTPLDVASINDLHLAASLVSFAVNDTMKEAVEVLQMALGVIPVDGAFGPVTLAHVNGADSGLLARFQAGWGDFYRRDVANHPDKEQFLTGWLRRAALIYPATL